jgi:hypothetical protein
MKTPRLLEATEELVLLSEQLESAIQKDDLNPNFWVIGRLFAVNVGRL